MALNQRNADLVRHPMRARSFEELATALSAWNNNNNTPTFEKAHAHYIHWRERMSELQNARETRDRVILANTLEALRGEGVPRMCERDVRDAQCYLDGIIEQADVDRSTPFDRSNFHKLYKEAKRNPGKFKDRMPAEAKKRMAQLTSPWLWIFPASYSEAEAAVRMWTEDQFFAAINDALIADTETLLTPWMWMIVKLNEYLVAHPMASTVTVYRGSKMTVAQRNQIQPGKYYRMCMFAAASMDEQVAEAFSAENVVLKFIVPENLKNACNISRISKYPEEEVLFPPYTAVACCGVTSNVIEFNVLDNLLSEDAMPSIFA